MGSLLQGVGVSARRRASQASVGLLVAGLHLAGVLVWWAKEHSMQLAPHHAPPPTVAVWLPALPKPDTTPTLQAHRPTRAPDPTGLPRPRNDDKPIAPSPTADVATATATASTGAPLPTETPGSPEGQAPATPALNLNLSRKDITWAAPRSFAEQSPFRGRLPKTVERQIANAAAETGPWTEERIDNDHIRFRRGNTCVTMQRPRAASIDPFNEAAARIPWRASKAEECND